MSEQNEPLNPLATEGGLVPPSDAERNDAPEALVEVTPEPDGIQAVSEESVEQLQADLDAAVEAEPEIVTGIGGTPDWDEPGYEAPTADNGSLDVVIEQAEQDAGIDAVPAASEPAPNITQEELDARFDADIDYNIGIARSIRAADAAALERNMTTPPEFSPNLKPGEVTVDANGLQWVCLGKVQDETIVAPVVPDVPVSVTTTVSTKFKAVNGGSIVYAQKIKAFSQIAQTGQAFVVLSDGSTHPRPLTHGYAPHTGDYYVQMVPITKLSDDRPYFEAPDSAIIGGRLFEQLYVPAE